MVDAGKHKEMRFDERRQVSRLVESFISRANAKQRQGRAGRVQEGLCYHLFTKERHDYHMADQQTPEILRLSLQDLIMRVKICKLGDIQATLAEALDAPTPKNIQRAIDTLIEVGALTADQELTSLGQELSRLPLDPYLGKLVLHGGMFGCLDAALTIAAILTSKSPFVMSAEGGKATDVARQSFSKGDSDLLTEYNAYCSWRRVCINQSTGSTGSEYQFCKRNMLSQPTLSNIEDLKAQLLSSLVESGSVSVSRTDLQDTSLSSSSSKRSRRFVTVPPQLNIHAENRDLVNTVIAWSFYPKILTREGKGWRNIATNQSISIHPSSVFGFGSAPNVKLLSFYSILRSGSGTKYVSSCHSFFKHLTRWSWFLWTQNKADIDVADTTTRPP